MARNKRALITGCTSGIGQEVARSLAAKNFDLILIGRDEARLRVLQSQVVALSSNPIKVDYFVCDFESLEQVSKVSKLIGKAYRDLDVLVNNAGIWESKHRKDSHGLEMTWIVNYFAPFVLTYNLFPLMKQTARDTKNMRIISVASDAHKYGQIAFPLAQTFHVFKTYGSTKWANMLNASYLAGLVREDGIFVNSVHPGVVATDLWKKLPSLVANIAKKFMRTPEKGAETAIFLASSPNMRLSGQYLEDMKIAKPTELAQNADLQKQLFGETKKLLKEYLIG